VEQITRIFIDTSKSIFQLHGVDAAERPVLRRKLRRKEMIPFFAALTPTVVGLEACGGAHHWARELAALGHSVKLIAPQHVKPYVKRNKNDGRDAEAGCEAMSRPTMRFVPVKTAEQQAALMLANQRERLIGQRTALSNSVRGHAAEFGLTAPSGLAHLQPLLSQAAEDEAVPRLAKRLFEALGRELAEVQAHLRAIEAELLAWRGEQALCRRLEQLPGVGPIGSALLAMKLPAPAVFRSGRDFAAWMGLTPKDHSTAGRQRLGGITRAGDEALRSTLVVGATAVVQQARRGRGPDWPWLKALVARKPPKLAAVALANKLARIAWKLMTTGEAYDPARPLRAAARLA
jgi:transposase